MGGDHKCPVCQATFTRPQHVARHMRSHTGDRPYKCQHCGDQFARSDLLSRHVNKCHAAEKALLSSSGSSAAALNSLGGGGRRKGTTAATRATTSKQACDQCVQSSLPCDGSNPCAKCVARKTRCTFVKFHRQTAPVGPGHPSSLSASTLPSGHLPSLSASSSGHPSLSSSHPSLSGDLMLGGIGGAGGGGGGGGPFLYAQQAAGGGGYGGDRFAHHPDSGPRFAGGGGSGGGGSNAGSPTSAYADGFERREREGLPYSYAPSGPFSYAPGAGAGEFEYADSEHSGHSASVSGGSRPASSAGGLQDYAPYLPNGHGRHSASLDLHHHPSASDLHLHHDRPPEFSSAFGLMSLDDPNVLAGLATDGVPFFTGTTGTGRTGLTPGAGPSLPPLHAADGGARRSSMQLVPPQALAYQAYSPPSSSHSHSSHSHSHSQSSHSSHLSHQGGGPPQAQTPGTREAETRELREFWKAYMRTPLTGPAGDALGLQTPSANAGAGLGAGGMLGTPTAGRRYRVASLPSVKTPEGEMDAAPVYPIHHHAPHQPPHHPSQQQQQQPQQQQGAPTARTMHTADDLRSYEAAVLARKAPELVLRKPTRRPVTSAGTVQQLSPHAQQAPPPPPPPIFEFGAAARERGGALEGAAAAASQGQSQSSSLAGAFGFGQGYAAAPPAAGAGNSSSLPGSPFPGTPTSASASASASEDGDEGEGSEGGSRPSFKRLPSQTLGPPETKRRREKAGGAFGVGLLAPLTIVGEAQARGGAGAGAGGEGRKEGAGTPSVNTYPDRPMIALRAPPGAVPLQRRARRLSAPASPTAPGFGID